MRPIPQEPRFTEDDDTVTVSFYDVLSKHNNTTDFGSLTVTTPYGRLCNDLEDVLEDHGVSKQTKRRALAEMIAEVGVDDS